MREKMIIVCTVVFYDGVEGYTTHRALWIDCTGKYQLTAKSKKAIKKDFDQAGCEVLKIDLNGQSFDGAVEFMEKFDANSMYRADDKEVDYVKNKFMEYFLEG